MSVTIRQAVAGDRDRLVEIIGRQTNFLQCEIDIAVEVVDASFMPAESYRLLVATDVRDQLWGFTVYGPIPLTEKRYDLYWIAVDPTRGRSGVGSQLLASMERDIAKSGGGHIYIDTSSTAGYRRARRFYEKNGYRLASRLENFYRDGDDRIIYRKIY